MGDVEASFLEAEKLLPAEVNLLRKSKLYKTAAWQMKNAPDFLNQAWEISTSLFPHQLLKVLLRIEEKLGRKRNNNGKGYESRNLDIDILFFEDLIINDSNLKIPHPRFSDRLFAVAPLCELAPLLVHPIEQRSVEEIRISLEEKITEAQL